MDDEEWQMVSGNGGSPGGQVPFGRAWARSADSCTLLPSGMLRDGDGIPNGMLSPGRPASGIGFLNMQEVVLEEQSRNNSFARGKVAKAENRVQDSLDSLAERGILDKSQHSWRKHP